MVSMKVFQIPHFLKDQMRRLYMKTLAKWELSLITHRTLNWYQAARREDFHNRAMKQEYPGSSAVRFSRDVKGGSIRPSTKNTCTVSKRIKLGINFVRLIYLNIILVKGGISKPLAKSPVYKPVHTKDQSPSI